MKKIINIILFIAVVCISLFLPMTHFDFYQKLVLTIIVWIVGIFLYFKNLNLFIPALFFIINTVLCPVSLYLMKILSINIPQIYFLLSILVYLFIVLNVHEFKNNVSWLHWGKFDKTIIFLIFIMIVLTGSTLFIWALFIKIDLSEFQEFIPNVPLVLLIPYGFVFPILNSFFEEFMARAVLFDGFLNIFRNIVVAIIGQALVFSLWHYNGFPGGIIGVILVFIWSIFLGIIRYRAKGMLPPLIAHFFADLSIAAIIFFLVILPHFTIK